LYSFPIMYNDTPICTLLFFYLYLHLSDLHSFPTRRSSDLFLVTQGYNGKFSHQGPNQYATDWKMPEGTPVYAARGGIVVSVNDEDRKSTRLNSSHVKISYAVFCLKKKKKKKYKNSYKKKH